MHTSAMNRQGNFCSYTKCECESSFSTNQISKHVIEGKHVYALTPLGNLTHLLSDMVNETVIFFLDIPI